eukprot:SAG31_NODE_35890_length_318_cov_1.415525_1_plen_33_part_01
MRLVQMMEFCALLMVRLPPLLRAEGQENRGRAS